MYIGYTVNFDSAYNLFPINYASNRVAREALLVEYLTKYNLELHYIDKGLYALGLRIVELSNLGGKIYSVDDSLELILKYKKKVVASFIAANADMSNFEIAHLEEESETVRYPQPYLFCANSY